MATFAQIGLDPGIVLAWVVAGLTAGVLVRRVTTGGGYGLVGDTIAGLVGALACGSSFAMLVAGTTGFVGSVAAAFLGACPLIWAGRELTPGRSYA